MNRVHKWAMDRDHSTELSCLANCEPVISTVDGEKWTLWSKSNEQVEPISRTWDKHEQPEFLVEVLLIAPAHSALNSQAEYSIIFTSRATATEYITWRKETRNRKAIKRQKTAT